MSTQRPLPVPDESSLAYWKAASEHVLTVARCTNCATLTLPPDVVCTACGTTDPAYEFTAVSGRAVVRSWTVVRQALLPGFDRDLPFILVDVELVEQTDLRLVARLLGGDEADLRIGAEVRVTFEDLTDEISVPAFELVR